MTTDVAVQSGYAVIFPIKAVVATQATYLAVFPGTRVSVADQAAYLVLLDTNPPVTRRRRVAAVCSG